jgi:hypothetical protein
MREEDMEQCVAAIKKGEATEFHMALGHSKITDVNVATAMLHLAIKLGHIGIKEKKGIHPNLDIVKSLLQAHGADPMKPYTYIVEEKGKMVEYQYNAFVVAACYGQKQIMKVLLSQNYVKQHIAAIDDKRPGNLLDLCVRKNELEVDSRPNLLGIDPGIYEIGTPLYFAVKYGFPEIAIDLIDSKARIYGLYH